MNVGYTGSRDGMTKEQKKLLMEFFQRNHVTVLNHGDCIGADAQADTMAMVFGVKRIAHPPDDDKLRSFCGSEIVMPRKPYIERNRDIVDNSYILIGCPKSKKEMIRSGTWATIRYAKRIGKPVIIFYPDGETERF